MNAVVQCLSNTDLLAEFLALGPLRARGEVTRQLAALVRALWTLDYTPQLSVQFKVSSHLANPRLSSADPCTAEGHKPNFSGPSSCL
ncbi:ubiquitin carboxyl-terminal hydrolase 43, partial [Alligator sinensis]|uniref:Ubiquitin carboxyl-terminal hydrolase 43 n=1 Tax=Alligator sinensis TaxID=38654 RepID=A0A3Q0HDV5_ALLSI